MSPIAANVIRGVEVEAFYPEKLVADLKAAGISEAVAREVAEEVARKVYPNVPVNILRGWVEAALERRSREAAALYRLYEQSKRRLAPPRPHTYRHRGRPGRRHVIESGRRKQLPSGRKIRGR